MSYKKRFKDRLEKDLNTETKILKEIRLMMDVNIEEAKKMLDDTIETIKKALESKLNQIPNILDSIVLEIEDKETGDVYKLNYKDLIGKQEDD